MKIWLFINVEVTDVGFPDESLMLMVSASKVISL
jgi:hypothetical protein